MFFKERKGVGVGGIHHFPHSCLRLKVIAPHAIINPIDSVPTERLMRRSQLQRCRNMDRLNKHPEI